LVDSNSGIIAGHGRLLAARKLQFKQVPMLFWTISATRRSAPTSWLTISSR
jgi:hypothetical protein